VPIGDLDRGATPVQRAAVQGLERLRDLWGKDVPHGFSLASGGRETEYAPLVAPRDDVAQGVVEQHQGAVGKVTRERAVQGGDIRQRAAGLELSQSESPSLEGCAMGAMETGVALSMPLGAAQGPHPLHQN